MLARTAAFVKKASKRQKLIWTTIGSATAVGILFGIREKESETKLSSLEVLSKRADLQMGGSPHPSFLSDVREVAAAQLGTAIQAVESLVSTEVDTTSVKQTITKWLAEWSEDPEAREAVTGIGTSHVFDFLVKYASEGSAAHQGHAQRALVNFLKTDRTASRLLSRPGALVKLMTLSEPGARGDELRGALQYAVAKGDFQWAVHLEDVRALMDMLQDNGSSPALRTLACIILSKLCAGYRLNATHMSALGLVKVLGESCSQLVEEGGSRELTSEMMRFMRQLLSLRNGDMVMTDAELMTWVQPLLYVAADASVEGDEDLACVALDVVGQVALLGERLVGEALWQCHAWPTLERLMKTEGQRVRLHAVEALGNLTAGGLVAPGPDEAARLRDVMLEWLCDRSSRKDLRRALVKALSALAGADGIIGLQVSHHWLSRLLLHLSYSVNPDSALLNLEATSTSTADMAEDLAMDLSPLVPAYARRVADELKRASVAVAESLKVLPPEVDISLLTPAAVEAYPAAALTVDMVVAQEKVSQALEMLSTLVADSGSRQRWLGEAGLFTLLERLCILREEDTGGEPPEQREDTWRESIHEVDEEGAEELLDGTPGPIRSPGPLLSVRRQTARLLCLMCSHPALVDDIASRPHIEQWLEWAAASKDCRLASHGRRALLNLTRSRLLRSLSPSEVQLVSQQVPVFWDGIHLLNPSAKHHVQMVVEPLGSKLVAEDCPAGSGGAVTGLVREHHDIPGMVDQPLALLRSVMTEQPPDRTDAQKEPPHGAQAREEQGTKDASRMLVLSLVQAGDLPELPALDVVFIHGIRGGPFVTWRRQAVFQPGYARHHLDHDSCWPAAWLPEDLPRARLLSVEYPAPVSGWEGESRPLSETVSRLLEKLVMAGVGQRPVVFVAHSMGGLLVKEMLLRGHQEGPSSRHRGIAEQTKGVIFYSTPHFGSSLATMGWRLRHLPGAAPAPSIERLQPGPHLVELNEHLRQLHSEDRVAVLSYIEGKSTSVVGFIPKIQIVPFESAYPGFGLVHYLEGHDHIDVCKPVNREDVAYDKTKSFLQDIVRRVDEEAQRVEVDSPLEQPVLEDLASSMAEHVSAMVAGHQEEGVMERKAEGEGEGDVGKGRKPWAPSWNFFRIGGRVSALTAVEAAPSAEVVESVMTQLHAKEDSGCKGKCLDEYTVTDEDLPW